MLKWIYIYIYMNVHISVVLNESICALFLKHAKKRTIEWNLSATLTSFRAASEATWDENARQTWKAWFIASEAQKPWCSPHLTIYTYVKIYVVCVRTIVDVNYTQMS